MSAGSCFPVCVACFFPFWKEYFLYWLIYRRLRLSCRSRFLCFHGVCSERVRHPLRARSEWAPYNCAVGCVPGRRGIVAFSLRENRDGCFWQGRGAACCCMPEVACRADGTSGLRILAQPLFDALRLGRAHHGGQLFQRGFLDAFHAFELSQQQAFCFLAHSFDVV